MQTKLVPKKEIKAMFFAQYWSQYYQYKNQYGTYKGTMSDSRNLYHFNEHLSDNAVLLLKPIDKLSDDDYKQIPVSKIRKKETFIDWCLDENEDSQHVWADYLRKLG